MIHPETAPQIIPLDFDNLPANNPEKKPLNNAITNQKYPLASGKKSYFVNMNELTSNKITDINKPIMTEMLTAYNC